MEIIRQNSGRKVDVLAARIDLGTNIEGSPDQFGSRGCDSHLRLDLRNLNRVQSDGVPCAAASRELHKSPLKDG